MSVNFRLQKLAAAVGLAIVSPAVLASGFTIPELNATGIGLSNALVANPEQIGAVPYNPAAMGFHEGHNVSGGAMILFPDLKVSTATGTHESGGDDPVFIPHLQGMFSVNDKLRLGLGVQAPFGLESKWDVGAFPDLSVPIGPLPDGSFLPPGLFHPTHSKLEMIGVVPTVAYRVTENLSLSAGVNYYDARKVLFNTGIVTIRGDGSDWGWNAGAMFNSGDLTIGINYHSEADIGLDGSFTALGTPSIPVDAELNLPSRLQAGIRYAFTDALALEFDWTRTGWSAFDQLTVTAKGSGTVLTNSDNSWEDANAYRLGLSYNLTPKTQLRFGYTYDEPGQQKDRYSPRVPDDNRQLFSIGLGHSFGEGWQVDGGYMYVVWDDNDYRSNRPFNPLTGDANGTSAYNGDYEANVHIFGLSVNKTFL